MTFCSILRLETISPAILSGRNVIAFSELDGHPNSFAVAFFGRAESVHDAEERARFFIAATYGGAEVLAAQLSNVDRWVTGLVQRGIVPPRFESGDFFETGVVIALNQSDEWDEACIFFRDLIMGEEKLRETWGRKRWDGKGVRNAR